MIIAALIATLFTGAALAAFQLRNTFFLRATIDNRPTAVEIPVGEDGNVRLLFTDADGAEQELIIRPEDVDSDGVIRGMQWHFKEAPAGVKERSPPP